MGGFLLDSLFSRKFENVFGGRNVPGVEAAEQRLAHACVHNQLLLHISVALPREVRHGVRDEGGRVDPCLGSTYARARNGDGVGRR